MKISVNLATHPFVELRPLFARLRLAMVALLVLGLALGLGLHIERARAAVAQARMDALKNETSGYQNQLSTNESRMREPQNRALLDRAQFLNNLFANKSFSWTAVMMDLETVLPAGVQVTSIEPQITKEGDVNIRLRVNGDRERAVELIRNLERSKRFLAPHLTTEALMTAQGTGPKVQLPEIPGGVEFDILSGYNPLPLNPDKQPDKHSAEHPDKHSGEHPDKLEKHPAQNPNPHPGLQEKHKPGQTAAAAARPHTAAPPATPPHATPAKPNPASPKPAQPNPPQPNPAIPPTPAPHGGAQ
jgi:type IV pilus assembly protein PilN